VTRCWRKVRGRRWKALRGRLEEFEHHAAVPHTPAPAPALLPGNGASLAAEDRPLSH